MMMMYLVLSVRRKNNRNIFLSSLFLLSGLFLLSCYIPSLFRPSPPPPKKVGLEQSRGERAEKRLGKPWSAAAYQSVFIFSEVDYYFKIIVIFFQCFQFEPSIS